MARPQHHLLVYAGRVFTRTGRAAISAGTCRDQIWEQAWLEFWLEFWLVRLLQPGHSPHWSEGGPGWARLGWVGLQCQLVHVRARTRDQTIVALRSWTIGSLYSIPNLREHHMDI